MTNNDISQIPLETIAGKALPFSEMKSKVLLFVNTASECGYTKQYKGLEALYEKYKDQGLVVIGVPCNQFGDQEPGTEKEIKAFCEMKFGVQFPMLMKADVKGAKQHPLYKFLIDHSTDKDEIKWNFEKFLVGKDGKVLHRYKSGVEPAELMVPIEKALAN